jgi:hypothetical protein
MFLIVGHGFDGKGLELGAGISRLFQDDLV